MFDEVPWRVAAQREHDTFTALLTAEGVSVHWLDDLLTQALGARDVRDWVISAALDPARLGAALSLACWDHLASLPPAELAEKLVAGLRIDEVPDAPATLATQTAMGTQFVVRPLPNTQFVRDSGSWIGAGLSVNRMARPARAREPVQLSAAFGATAGRLWAGATAPAPLEGGDILVVGDGCVLVGVGERTSPVAAEALAAELYERDIARTVIAICLPRRRQTMHLDTVMSMVDHDTFLASAVHLQRCEAYLLTPGGGVRGVDCLFDAVAEALNLPAVRVITTGGDGFAQRREQWSDAANVLALRPGVVVAYDRNTYTNDALAHAGIKVLPIPSAELSRGRGGPHCLSCPLRRDRL